ncbi:hypothetical protein D3C84_1035710 [compost metagenome]
MLPGPIRAHLILRVMACCLAASGRDYSVKRIDAEPISLTVSSKWSPAWTGTSGTSEPDRMISPARRGTPKPPRVLASQATASAG